MKRLVRQLDRRGGGPPPIVLGLLAAEVLITIALLLLGVPFSDLLSRAGPVIVITLAFLNPTVQELGRRRPALSLVADGANEQGEIDASALPPWPVDVDRIVANEVAEARETLSYENVGRAAWLVRDPFAIPPSDADRVRAREAFEQELTDYEAKLRKWLEEYVLAAVAHSQTFEVSLTLTNGPRGAHAEEVTVALNLPETVTVVDQRPKVAQPPERPHYEPPQPRSPSWLIDHPVRSLFPRDLSGILPRLTRRDPAWKVGGAGQRLESVVGGVHSGRSVAVGEPLLLAASGAGRHEVHWTVYTTSARRAACGSIALVVPKGEERPAFGRLGGVLSYPDVPIVGEKGEVLHEPRVADPPLRAPESEGGDGVLEKLRRGVANAQWKGLGLEPATDGIDRVVVNSARRVSDD